MTRWVLGVVLFCALPVRADREVLTIPSYAMPRASDEVKLMALLKQDIEDAHMHHVDYRPDYGLDSVRSAIPPADAAARAAGAVADVGHPAQREAEVMLISGAIREPDQV